MVFNELRPEGHLLPRQHSLVHYSALIRGFGAPNGLCSSITESRRSMSPGIVQAVSRARPDASYKPTANSQQRCFSLDFVRTLVLNVEPLPLPVGADNDGNDNGG